MLPPMDTLVSSKEQTGTNKERREVTVPGRQGQRPEYQEVESVCWRLSGWSGAFSAQGTSVLKQPRLCLSLRTPSRSKGLSHSEGWTGNKTLRNKMFSEI